MVFICNISTYYNGCVYIGIVDRKKKPSVSGDVMIRLESSRDRAEIEQR